MKLSEILAQLVADNKLTAEESNSISQELDTIKANAVKELETQVSALTKELEPFKADARATAIKSKLPEGVKEEFIDDLIALSKISDDDNEDSIATKLKEAYDKRPYMKGETKVESKAGVKDPQVKDKVETNNSGDKTESDAPAPAFAATL